MLVIASLCKETLNCTGVSSKLENCEHQQVLGRLRFAPSGRRVMKFVVVRSWWVKGGFS